MLERVPEFEAEYADVLARLSDPEVGRDPRTLRDLSRRRKELEGIVETMRGIAEAQSDARTAQELFEEASGAERELARQEIDEAAARLSSLDEKLRGLLLPKDPNDGRNVIVEIRGAEGGEEANLFAKDLFDMYQHYADRRGWRVEIPTYGARTSAGSTRSLSS